ncbi:hypothetical protein KR215_009611, partial [Drosophila sulfurigaster]
SRRQRTLLTHIFMQMSSLAGLAVKCYECDSENDLNCGSEFQAEDIAKTDCDAVELPQEIREIYIQKPDTACLIKYYRDRKLQMRLHIHKGGLNLHILRLLFTVPDNPLFVRRSCTFGDFSVCDEQPDPVMPHLSFLGCQFCHTDLCN